MQQKKPSALKREHLTLENMKILILNFFIFVGNFCPPGSGSALIKMLILWIQSWQLFPAEIPSMMRSSSSRTLLRSSSVYTYLEISKDYKIATKRLYIIFFFKISKRSKTGSKQKEGAAYPYHNNFTIFKTKRQKTIVHVGVQYRRQCCGSGSVCFWAF
jgi:hypothetical protein